MTRNPCQWLPSNSNLNLQTASVSLPNTFIIVTVSTNHLAVLKDAIDASRCVPHETETLQAVQLLPKPQTPVPAKLHAFIAALIGGTAWTYLHLRCIAERLRSRSNLATMGACPSVVLGDNNP